VWPDQPILGLVPRKKPTLTDVYLSACDGKINLTGAQAAHFLGCSLNHVHHLAGGGHLHPVRVGGVLVFARTDLARYRKVELELEIAQELQLGTHPLDVFFKAAGRYKMADVEAAMRDWAKLTGCWVIEAPRGSYARWLERTGLERVGPRQLRRFIEGMLTDPALADGARRYFADQRTANGLSAGQAQVRAQLRARREAAGGKRARELELEQRDDATATR
jgi:hypothetical protein